MGENLVIAFQQDHFMGPAAFDQEIDHLPRLRPAIDVIAEKHMQRPFRLPMAGEIGVDCGE